MAMNEELAREAMNPNIAPERWNTLATEYPVEAYLNPARELFALENPALAWSGIEEGRYRFWISVGFDNLWYESKKTAVHMMAYAGATYLINHPRWSTVQCLLFLSLEKPIDCLYELQQESHHMHLLRHREAMRTSRELHAIMEAMLDALIFWSNPNERLTQLQRISAPSSQPFANDLPLWRKFLEIGIARVERLFSNG